MRSEKRSLEIESTRYEVYARSGGRCEVCYRDLPLAEGELAHRIPQTKSNITEYGPAVIHHPLNLAWTHPGPCNASVLIGNDPVATRELLAAIVGVIVKSSIPYLQARPADHRELLAYLSKLWEGM